MKPRRVVITGVGAVTPIGTAVDGLWNGLVARRSAVRTLSRFDPAPFRSKIAAEIPDFRPQDFLEAKRAKRLDRFSQLVPLEIFSIQMGRHDSDRRPPSCCRIAAGAAGRSRTPDQELRTPPAVVR